MRQQFEETADCVVQEHGSGKKKKRPEARVRTKCETWGRRLTGGLKLLQNQIVIFTQNTS